MTQGPVRAPYGLQELSGVVALQSGPGAVAVRPEARAAATSRQWLQRDTSGCSLVQLTSDKSRTDAHRFYERLGFVASHEGFKLRLS